MFAWPYNLILVVASIVAYVVLLAVVLRLLYPRTKVDPRRKFIINGHMDFNDEYVLGMSRTDFKNLTVENIEDFRSFAISTVNNVCDGWQRDFDEYSKKDKESKKDIGETIKRTGLTFNFSNWEETSK